MLCEFSFYGGKSKECGFAVQILTDMSNMSEYDYMRIFFKDDTDSLYESLDFRADWEFCY